MIVRDNVPNELRQAVFERDNYEKDTNGVNE